MRPFIGYITGGRSKRTCSTSVQGTYSGARGHLRWYLETSESLDIRSQLYNVQPMDPLTGGAVVVLAATAFAASYLPARRAAALDPRTALRET
jgi:hypothetical protein